LLYLSEVLRPGDQLGLPLDLTPLIGLPGAVGPVAFRFLETDFWAQGVNFGLEFVW
jgi:hypothetical protein